MAGTSFAASHPTIANLWVRETLSTDSNLIISGYCTGAPDTTANVYEHGCILTRTDSGTGVNAVYQNTGSAASPVWTLFDTGTGFSIPTVATDATTTTGTSFALTQNTVTTGNGLTQSLNGLTTGTGQTISHTTSVIASGGSLLRLSSTGIDTSTTTGTLLDLSSTASLAATQVLETFSGLTTGVGHQIVTAALTTGNILVLKATAATLTTGRYLSVNDTAGEVFGIGTNGHLISTVSASVPTIAVTAQVGITAAAITAGGSDTCGIITTTGTSTGSTILDVTFGKTYTTAPKAVILVPANAAAAMPNTGYYVSAVSATGFTITVAAAGTYAATPSFRYAVIA